MKAPKAKKHPKSWGVNEIKQYYYGTDIQFKRSRDNNVPFKMLEVDLNEEEILNFLKEEFENDKKNR